MLPGVQMSVCDAYDVPNAEAASEALYMEINNHASAITSEEEGGENNTHGKV